MCFGMRAAGPDGEAVQAVVGLGPPSIENRQIETSVEHYLLAACSGSLQRTAWIIQPDVDTLHEMTANIDIVVFDEDKFVAELTMLCQLGDFLQNSFAGLVSRMSLAGEDELHRPF